MPKKGSESKKEPVEVKKEPDSAEVAAAAAAAAVVKREREEAAGDGGSSKKVKAEDLKAEPRSFSLSACPHPSEELEACGRLARCVWL